MTRERPILFSAPMVRAILAGTKTQTRRVIKPSWARCLDLDFDDDRERARIGCPYGPGDRLWVKHGADVFDIYYKPIAGWEDRYAAGTDGRIYRTDGISPEPLIGSPSSKGYLTVSLSRGKWETHAIHKLICETFYGPAPFTRAQVRHLDGDQTNNRPENLDWGTAEQNWQDRKAHGRGMGNEHHAAKLTAQQVSEIRASVLSQRALAARYGVSQSTIHEARSGETWGEHEPAPRTLPAFSLWRSPLFMPRWASRITLEVTGVRVERLHDIDELGALAEGVEGESVHSVLNGERGEYITGSARAGFVDLWRDINGRASWDANPWVWVVEFRRVASQLGERAA